MFINATNIRYCMYSESHRILGQTFGMCVLQDFEALTPNLLARTIETVEGGWFSYFVIENHDLLETAVYNDHGNSACWLFKPDSLCVGRTQKI